MRYVFLMVVLAFSFMTDGVAETRSFGGTGGEVHILTTDDREIGFVNSTPPFACSHFHIVTARDTYLGGPRVVYRCYLYQAGTQREGGRDWKHYVFGPEQVAFPRTTAGAPSLAGTWQGTWKNSTKKVVNVPLRLRSIQVALSSLRAATVLGPGRGLARATSSPWRRTARTTTCIVLS